MICNATLTLKDKTIEYLKDKLHRNDFEVSGDFSISKGEKENQYYLGIGKILNEGNDEKVAKVESRYSFHTHPQVSYVKFNVTRGIPSNWDYLLFLKCYCDEKINTIFHIVVSLEGLYILSVDKEYCNIIVKVTKSIENFIMDNYGEEPRKNLNISNYCYRMSENKYKKKRLFSVKFISWENVDDSSFNINYRPVDKSCELTN